MRISTPEIDVNNTQGQRHNQKSFNRAARLTILLIGSVLAISMVGCGSAGKSIIKGRVIAGPVGQAVSASPEDERFEELGIPGVKVVVLSKDGSSSRGRGVYAKATSDDWGNFEIAFNGGQYPRDAIQIRVEGEGVFTSKSITFLPPDGDRLLCVVITRPGYVIPEPPEDEKSKK